MGVAIGVAMGVVKTVVVTKFSGRFMVLPNSISMVGVGFSTPPPKLIVLTVEVMARMTSVFGLIAIPRVAQRGVVGRRREDN